MNRRTAIAIGAAAAVLIAAMVGLVAGNGASDDGPDQTLSTKEVFLKARETTMAEVKAELAKAGYREGLKTGLRQGSRAGRRAGETDGKARIQLEATEAAQSAAAAAQSELSAISAPPPAPPAPAPAPVPVPVPPGQ